MTSHAILAKVYKIRRLAATRSESASSAVRRTPLHIAADRCSNFSAQDVIAF